MGELIKIEVNENQEIIVSGRELHKGLEVESRYNDWFKRMLKYGFEENLDYIAITQKKVTAQGNETTYIDHVIKLDMAKEICMLQRNDKGRKFRKYFIECEKRLKEQQLPQLTRKEELQLQLFSEDSLEVVNAHKELVKIEVEEATKPLLGKIEEDKPLVDFAETISKTSDSISIGDFAKLIKDEGIKLGRNKLFEWLRDNKYLMKDNKPYQKYIDNGYFEIIEYSYNTPYGSKFGIKTLITGIGQIKIIEKLRKENN
ncbi:MAG: phage antirepressor KilAC domain-containing protein [Clostridia bacterium]